MKLDNTHTIFPDGYNKNRIKGGHNEMNINDYIIDENKGLMS